MVRERRVRSKVIRQAPVTFLYHVNSSVREHGGIANPADSLGCERIQ